MEPQNAFQPVSESKPWVIRHGFGLLPPVMIWFFVAFVLFQLVGGLVGVGLFIALEDLDWSNPAQSLQMINEYPLYLLTGNSAGQFIVIGFLSWLVVGLYSASKKRSDFTRMDVGIDASRASLTLLVVLFLAASYPLLTVIGYFNAMVPQPEFMLEMEKASMEILTKFMSGDTPSWLIFFHVALTPAICEEIMFRGLILRVLEHRFGTKKAIVFSGFLFGLYHLRINQLLVLSIIGMLLAWITIRSGSLYPAMIIHAINNGLLSLSPRLFPEFYEKYLNTDAILLPAGWLIALSVVLTLSLGYIIYRRTGIIDPSSA